MGTRRKKMMGTWKEVVLLLAVYCYKMQCDVGMM